MSIFDRGIRGNIQNPFNNAGDAGTIGYSNPRLPQDFNGNVQLALDAAFDYMFPNYKATVNTPTDLPATGTQGDYYIVKDDGDGKPAGYVWSDLGGFGSWNKRYDVDWSYEGLLSDAVEKTSSMYPAKYGSTDRDQAGNEYTGVFAGQIYYGGNKAAQNLTLAPNSQDTGDGFVQLAGQFRPIADHRYDLGTPNYQFRTASLSGSLILNKQTTFTPGVITDTTGALVFSNTNISSPKLTTSEIDLGTMVLSPSSIVDSSGTINFGSTELATTGPVMAGAGSVISGFTFQPGSLKSQTSVINFNGDDFAAVGDIEADTVTADYASLGGITLDQHTIETDAGPLTIQGAAGGTATTVNFNSKVTCAFDLQVTGKISADGEAIFHDALTAANSLKISNVAGNAKLETLSGADLLLSPAGVLSVASVILPDADSSRSLGSASKRFQHLYLSSGISDGTTEITSSVLQSLRSINDTVTTGSTLFWNGTQWLPSIPDTEIDHRALAHLTDGDAGHTQFAMLSGRAGGQGIAGGTAASENLTLDSTSNAAKGFVLFNSTAAPVTDNAIDLGSASRNFKDIYSLGVHKNLRFEAFNGPANYPTNSGLKIGRAIFDSSTNQLLVDTGATWAKIGQQKWLSDTTWDGTMTTLTVNVSAAISDARSGIWQFCDNTNGFERVYAKMTFTQTAVTITVSPALPAGSYRLIGLN